jgi:osmotically-inducible protein OsmY
MKTLLIALMLITTYVFAQESQPVPQGEYDDVAKAVEKKILGKDKIKIDQLKVLHSDNSIYLSGLADLYGSYYYAGKIASDFKGIKNVTNNIDLKLKDANDTDIQSTLMAEIQREMKTQPFDLVSVRVHHGFVQLSGIVRDQTLKDKAFEEAIWIPGVRQVENKIEYSSLSAADDRLRTVIYQLLGSQYPQYFNGAHPSIVILAEHGRVTLVGNVNSEVEKQRMLSTVRSISGVLSVNDQLSSH